MEHKLWHNPKIAILSLKRRPDRRNVAISSIMWSEFNIGNTRFVDAIDSTDYPTNHELIQDAVGDGFYEFDALHGFPVHSNFEDDSEITMHQLPMHGRCVVILENSHKKKKTNFLCMTTCMVLHTHTS